MDIICFNLVNRKEQPMVYKSHITLSLCVFIAAIIFYIKNNHLQSNMVVILKIV